jgi:hypothetical protein
MLTKSLLIALLAACGVNSGGATSPSEQSVDQPDKAPPDGPVVKDQHFCCSETDPKTHSGQGCNAIGKESINNCDDVLYCPEGWTKKDGNVTCA